MQKNKSYDGFTVIDVTDISELGATGIWLKHDVTGMEVYHLRNTDEENLFSFAFKTPPSDSTGAAHILEHSVLCGSKNYPLKDPFLQLSNQSVKTFLNAMTFPDKTLYPASSMVEADYFNLMAVYGDAVFFPLLEEWTFRQEAWRLETAADGKKSLQGVVYNEMKGNYSSSESIAAEWALRSILPETAYAFDSGGDPSCIPELTYEQFKKFHADYYHPTNCRLFLCGNIDTEKQLAFLNERFLRHFSAPHTAALTTIGFAKPFTAPVKIEVPAPAVSEDGSSGSNVVVNWLLGDAADPIQTMEAVFLCEILLGHDASPLNRALIESGLGEDLSPNSGLETEIRQLCLSAGLRGVQQKKADKVEKLIFSVLNDIAKNGVPAEEIQAACMSIDFANREVRRSGGGPFSLTLMRRALKSWLHGGRPDEALWSRRTFDIVKKRTENPDYVSDLCKKLLIENNHRSLLVVYPDKQYTTQFAESEEKRINSLIKNGISTTGSDFAAKLAEADSPENVRLIPHLHPSSLSPVIDKIDTKRLMLGKIPVYTHTENTNGIMYIDAGFPVDTLSPQDFQYLPLFTSAVTSVGFGGMDWSAASAYSARLCGGFGASLFTSSHASTPKLPEEGRSWVFFRIKMLEEKCEETVKMLFDCIKTADFTDEKRIKDLALEFRNDFDASIIPSGHQYASSRATRLFSRAKATDELWNGITQLFAAHRIASSDMSALVATFDRLRRSLVSSGIVLNITAEKNGIERALNAVKPHLQDFGALKPPFVAQDSDFFDVTAISSFAPYTKTETEADAATEAFTAATQVGFAAAGFKAHRIFSKESVYEKILGHWLSNSLLWEEIRTAGGAYGAFSYPDPLEGVFVFASYRDPKPEKSLEAFQKCLRSACETVLDNESLEKAVTGTYSKEVQPRSPANRGFTGFIRSLYGITDAGRELNMRTLLNASAEDIRDAAQNLAKNTPKMSSALIADKKTAGAHAVDLSKIKP